MQLIALIQAGLLFAVIPAMAVSEPVTAPACGIHCIATITLASTCSLANTTCICTNERLMKDINKCVQANCKIVEQLQTKRFSFKNCGVVGEDRNRIVLQIGMAFLSLGLVAYGLRCLERLRTSTWGLDDWITTLVVMILIPMCIVSIPQMQHGLGLDMWNVTPADISTVLYYFWWGEIFYATSLPLLKISALLFYLRVFPKKQFRYCCFVLITLHILYAIGFSLAIVFQCSPINGAWLGWTGDYNAKCASLNGIGWSAAAVNIFLDLTTIVLPIPQLVRLNMSIQKKLLLLLMFTVGLFVTVVSAIRLSSLIVVGSTANVTQDYVEVAYWSIIEVAVGVVCVCMPGIRALFTHGHAAIFGSRESQPSSGYGQQSSRSHRISTRPKFVSISSLEPDYRSQQHFSSENSENRSDVQLMTVDKQRLDSPDDRGWMPMPERLPERLASSVRPRGATVLDKPMHKRHILESHLPEQLSRSQSLGATGQEGNLSGIMVSQQWSVVTDEGEPGSLSQSKK